MGKVTQDDRDHYGKKRLDMAGTLLSAVFREKFRKYIQDAKKNLKKLFNKKIEANDPNFD